MPVIKAPKDLIEKVKQRNSQVSDARAFLINIKGVMTKFDKTEEEIVELIIAKWESELMVLKQQVEQNYSPADIESFQNYRFTSNHELHTKYLSYQKCLKHMNYLIGALDIVGCDAKYIFTPLNKNTFDNCDYMRHKEVAKKFFESLPIPLVKIDSDENQDCEHFGIKLFDILPTYHLVSMKLPAYLRSHADQLIHDFLEPGDKIIQYVPAIITKETRTKCTLQAKATAFFIVTLHNEVPLRINKQVGNGRMFAEGVILKFLPLEEASIQ